MIQRIFFREMGWTKSIVDTIDLGSNDEFPSVARISREVINEQLKRCATVLCSEALMEIASS